MKWNLPSWVTPTNEYDWKQWQDWTIIMVGYVVAVLFFVGLFYFAAHPPKTEPQTLTITKDGHVTTFTVE